MKPLICDTGDRSATIRIMTVIFLGRDSLWRNNHRHTHPASASCLFCLVDNLQQSSGLYEHRVVLLHKYLVSCYYCELHSYPIHSFHYLQNEITIFCLNHSICFTNYFLLFELWLHYDWLHYVLHRRNIIFYALIFTIKFIMSNYKYL